MGILSNEDLFYKIADFWFVRSAFQAIVFNKLFYDGYVCCNEGLYPNNKESLQKQLKGKSEFYSLIEKNPEDMQELYNRCVSMPSQRRAMTREEHQSIVYILLQTVKGGKSESFWLMVLMAFYFGKTRFCQYGNFIVENNIDLIKVESLEQYVKEVMEFPDNYSLLFRGHTNINYEIKPSLFRSQNFYKNEYMMYQELVLRCPDDFLKCDSHLDFLVEMQHYGLPTRLLDFSFNPLVAIYFACEVKDNTGEVIVYAVKNDNILYAKDKSVTVRSCLPMMQYERQCDMCNAMNDKFIREKEFGEYWNELRMELPQIESSLDSNLLRWPVFVKPTRNNRRIAHQEGAFLLWGLDPIVYSHSKDINADFMGDQEKYRFSEDDKRKIYYIPSSKKEIILKSLNRLGINTAYIYPEIDDVAAYIKNSMQ